MVVTEVADPREQTDFAVCPFVVQVDTREQAAFSFRSLRTDANEGKKPIIVRIEKKMLSAGDYSIVGFENQIAIERKEKGDCFHCMGADRERFEQQVQRLNKLNYGHIVVEADWASIFQGHPRSELRPKVIHRTVISWQFKYPNVRWWMCPGRAFAEATTFRILERFYRIKQAESAIQG